MFEINLYQKPVGGEFVPIEHSSLILAGSQLTASWLVPSIVSAVGIGIVFLRWVQNKTKLRT